jgi:ABC-type glycerol-3-phosphate transport system permease component
MGVLESLNGLHWTLVSLLGLFAALLAIKARWAWTFARVTVLVMAACLTLAPFAWLVCAAFKDPAILNTYTFLPSPQTISAGISAEPKPRDKQTIILTRMQEMGAIPCPTR